MSTEAASFAMPESYRVYSKLREGVDPQCAALGEGRNLMTPGAPLVRWLGGHFASGKLGLEAARYEEPEGCRQVIAAAMSLALRAPHLAADDVYITAGSTEAISIAMQVASSSVSTEAMLPLPGYFGFELSAMRWGVPIAGYIRPDGPPGCRQSQFEGLVIAVAPNGVSGFLPTPLVDSFPQASRFLVDCIYCSHGVQPGLIAALATNLHSYPLKKTLWSFTASKDLGIPGLRAGFIITQDSLVKHVATAHRLELSYTPPLVQSFLAALYALLLAAEQVRGSKQLSIELAVEHVWGLVTSELPASSGLNSVSIVQALIESAKELDSLADRCAYNWRVLQDWSTGAGAALTPCMGGFSALMRLPFGPSDQHALIKWVNDVGREFKLKLHPSVLYGGTVASWRRLFGTEWFLRVNLSNPSHHLESCLELLGQS